MNPLMWNNAATRRNVAQLERDGVAMIGPNAGEMAEAGEAGVGRMAEPLEIAAAAERFLRPAQPRPLAGKRILVTAGPTHEPIDPVRYIANRSSGKQGFAIAAAAQAAGADVTLISGPVELDDPAGVAVRHVESARDMLQRIEAALPVDIAIFAAAVADWRVANAGEQKLKKTSAGMPPLQLVENPDILATISKLRDKRPQARDRLRRRNRASDRQRQGKTRAQGLRLDRRQRRVARDRRDGRRPQHGSSADPRRRRHQGRFLAGDDQGRSRIRAGGAHRQRNGETIVSAIVKVDIRQLPHGEGLALPAYQSAHAAGLDLLAAVPQDAPLILDPRPARAGAHGPDDRPAAGL